MKKTNLTPSSTGKSLQLAGFQLSDNTLVTVPSTYLTVFQYYRIGCLLEKNEQSHKGFYTHIVALHMKI